MYSLAYKELVQIRRYLLQIVGFMAMTLIIFGRTSPSFAVSYLYVMPVVFGMTLPQTIFEQEERGNTFAFLRALPIRPQEIVVAKYLVSALLNFGFIAIIVLSGTAGLVAQGPNMAGISGVALASFSLSGLSFFVHFWLGSKSAKVALILVSFAAGAPIMLAIANKGALGAALNRQLTDLAILADTPSGLSLAIVLGLLVLGVSCAASSWIFTKRDLSRLP